jgi:excisionase family DNA binding protein
MPVATASNETLLVDEDVRQEAVEVLHQSFDEPLGELVVMVNGTSIPIPAGLSSLLVRVIEHTAEGGALTVIATPEELTTTVAADMLGVSRPTLMRLIADGQLVPKKVGTHNRLVTSDVLALKHARTRARRAAFDALRQLEQDES